MEAITVSRLLELCKMAQKRGLANKKILISNDDEVNGYHELFFDITEIKEDDFKGYSYVLPYGVSAERAAKEYVILG